MMIALAHQMVRAGKVSVDALLQITRVMNVMTVPELPMVLLLKMFVVIVKEPVK